MAILAIAAVAADAFRKLRRDGRPGRSLMIGSFVAVGGSHRVLLSVTSARGNLTLAL
jgi:hypothetical protein